MEHDMDMSTERRGMLDRRCADQGPPAGATERRTHGDRRLLAEEYVCTEEEFFPGIHVLTYERIRHA